MGTMSNIEILEADTIQQVKMKEAIRKEDLRQMRMH